MYIICTYAKDSVCLLCYDYKNATHTDDNQPDFKDNTQINRPPNLRYFTVSGKIFVNFWSSDVTYKKNGFGLGINDT